MSKQPSNPIKVSDVSTLMRACADNELTPDQQRALDAHLQTHPEDEARVAFERSLKGAVSRSMAGEGVPEGLAAAVMEAVRADAHGDSSDDSRHDAPIVETMARATRERSFWSGAARRLAVAAAVLLVASAGWFAFVQFRPNPIVTWGDVNRVQLAGFLSKQHVMCEDDAGFAGRKFTATDVSEIEACFERVIGKSPEIDRVFANGGRLVGMGECGVPGPGKSVHMQVTLPIGDGGDPGRIATQTTISLFIQQCLDRGGIEPETPYSLAEGLAEGYAVDVWERDELIYYLVCETPEAAAAARKALGIGVPNQSL